jgi:hypothetical protein
MNIKDVEHIEIKDDRLEAIFKRQLELTVRYKEMEKMPDFPMNPHVFESQLWFKEFAWRFTEEIGEAMACLVEPEGNDGEINWEHYQEELSDALHFFIELCIIIGTNPNQLIFGDKDSAEITLELMNTDLLGAGFILASKALEEIFEKQDDDGNTWVNYFSLSGFVSTRLSQAMNCLKNKRWKQSQMMTDIPKFITYIRETFLAFLILCMWSEIDSDILTDLYFRKSEVNKFRQRSNY